MKVVLNYVAFSFEPKYSCSHRGHVSEIEVVLISLPRYSVSTKDMCQRLKLSSSLCNVDFIPTKDMSQVEVVQSLFKAAQLFLLPQRTCNRSWSCPNLSARFLYSHKGHVSEIEVVLISFQAGFCLLVSLWIIIFSDLPFILFCRCFILIIKHGWTLVCGSLHSLLFHFNS